MKGLVHMYTDVFGNELKKKNRKCVKYVKKTKKKNNC